MFGKQPKPQLTMKDLIIFESKNLLVLGLGDVDYSTRELYTMIDSLIEQGHKILFADTGFASEHAICFQKPKESIN